MSFEDDEPQDDPTQIEEYDWRDYGYHDQSSSQDLEAKDILAIFIASLQTIFLPLVILGVFMVVLGLIVGIIF